MNLIITGGAGFIGSNFIYHILKKYPKYRIICLDSLTYAGNMSTLQGALQNSNFKFYNTNICDRKAIYKIFEEEIPDAVINFAAESHVDRSIEDPGIFLQTNIIGTAVIMDACRQYGNIRFHQISTDEVYGDLPLDRPDYSLLKKLRFIHQVLILLQKQAQICWFLRITALLVCL